VSKSFDAGYMGDDSGNPANPESPLRIRLVGVSENPLGVKANLLRVTRKRKEARLASIIPITMGLVKET
jgi:hypothetical protein